MPTHTLPPLQASQHAHATMQSLYGGGSAPHTPRTPATPNTPNSNPMGNFSQMGGQNRGYQMMQGGYQQPPHHQQQQQQQQQQQFRTSSAMMPQSSTAMSHPQAIAPAPIQNRMPQTLRPMPPNGLHPMVGMQPGYGQGMMMQNDMEPPTHVVGSQGRRGILPSAPGRPAVTTTGNGTAKSAMIPAKDADGKFPCPHCTKTYLHAKHLKRHLLRHTGDRPYMCVLCRDTFSRSDILKRHFQKCSIRRGNPTGASHLSAQAHVKKNQAGAHKATPSMTNPNDLMGLNGINNGMGNGLPFGVDPNGHMPDNGPNLTNEQVEQLQRNESLKRLGAGGIGDRRNMTGPSPVGSNRASFDQNYSGGIVGTTMPSGMNPSLAFSMPNGLNGHSYGQQGYDYATHGTGNANGMQSQSGAGQHALTWAQMYQSNVPSAFAGQYNSNIDNTQLPIKPDPSHPPPHATFSTVYPSTHPPASQSLPKNWNLQPTTVEEISNKITHFCFSDGHHPIGSRGNEIRRFLHAEFVGPFLENFDNFQVHFPVIHFPTFRRSDAYEGLLLAMICVGAVYSDRVSAPRVRELMEFAKETIERKSRVLANISQRPNGLESGSLGSSTLDVEEISAIFMMHILSTWNGTPVQREGARQQFPVIVELARRAGLTRPSTGSPFSILHQPNMENATLANFDWNAWVEQEKRSRLLYAIYLTDAAMGIFFNSPPLFEDGEIRLPLPADDAAFEACNAQECAQALGLQGPALAQQRNPSGTRRPKQPELHTAMRALRHQAYNLQPGSTNIYSKFVLIHALHVQLATVQKLSMESNQINIQHSAFPSSGASTPISQNDWIARTAFDPTSSGTPSANTSGRATPVDGINQSSQMLKATIQALEKWKQAWDEDMRVQYPPSSPQSRLGFCRDGVHFYWLATFFLKSRGIDPQLAPDQRFTYVMQLIQGVKAWVTSDSAQRGELLGSVSEIASDYGVTDLTLDMSQLFKSINQHRNPLASTGSGIS